jgi:hypothetical protein
MRSCFFLHELLTNSDKAISECKKENRQSDIQQIVHGASIRTQCIGLAVKKETRKQAKASRKGQEFNCTIKKFPVQEQGARI